ncbi:MAG: S9 family peptidase [Prevotellaceae bacterium]|jgi:dipeptidyl aminopeptidase/acylaminoacyl peptidase|nr:S9 family peptidase [Prevotellaceae bacterium]
MRKLLSLFILLFISLSVSAKDTIRVNQWSLAKTIVLKQPFINDTVNIFGAKCDDKFLLKSAVAQPAFKENISVLSANDEGFVQATKPDNNTAIYPFSFNITATAYTKARLVLTSPHMLEIYVNGKKSTEKLTVQKSLKDAKTAEVLLNMLPQNYTINIKYLYPANDSLIPSIKAILITDSNNAGVNVNPNNSVLKSPMTLEDVMEGERPSRVSVSPDGKYILAVSSISLGKNKQKTLYRIYDYNTNRLVLTSEDRGWSWMPRGSRLYYTLDTEKGKNLRILDLATMQEITLVESLPDGGFRWAPDESYLIFMISDRSPENKTGVNHILNPRDRQAGYRNRMFLGYYKLNTQVLQPLTFGNRSTYLAAISPDSKTIIFGTSRDNYTERPFSLSSYYLLNLETMQVDTLWKDIKYGNPVCFSPDGKQLLLTGGPESFDNIGLDPKVKGIPNSYDTQSYIYDLSSKKNKAISLNFNPSIKTAVWNKVDNNIYFTVDEEDRVNCYRYLVRAEKFEQMPFPVDLVLQFDMAEDTPAAAYVGQSTSYPSQLFKTDIKTAKSTVIYNPMKNRMDEMNLGKVEDWNFNSKNGDNIKGRYYLPYNFDSSKKYPMIVYYYGGTTPVGRNFDSRYPFHLYASMGYVVYVLHPSGTIGFGQQFSAWHVNAWGERTADDIIEGTKKFCDAHNFVDRAKVGCIGASYGGFMTMYLQTRTDIFAAAVSHAGISDVTSYWGEGYWGYSYNAVAASDSYPWNNRKVFVEQSPLYSADKVKTPILFVHGAADTNVPVGESIQMFTALKLLGKEAELITFDGENHFIMDADKRIRWQNSIFAWFARWLQNNDTWWNEMYPEKNL